MNRSCACTCTSGTRKWSPNISTTCPASSLRSSPWSTNTQVSWSPTALYTSSAATAESTPPESAHRTRSEPTCLRMRSTCSSITAAGVHAGRRAGDLVQEVLQHVHPVRRVYDLGMELHAVQRTLARLEGGHRRGRRARDHGRALGRLDHRVAVRHPDRLLGRRVLQQPRLLYVQVRLAELGDARAIDAAAEVEREQLRAVTDAERGDAELEDARIDVRRVLGVHGCRAAAEDDRVGIARAHRLGRDRVPDELGVHAALAHAPRDQLGVLPAEIDHQHRPVLGDRKLDDVRRLSGDSSAPLS